MKRINRERCASYFGTSYISCILRVVNIYELFDEPDKSAIESRFGLMYNINSPKVHINIITAFAGGTLSAAEQLAVTSLGILFISQISAYKDIAINSTSTP